MESILVQAAGNIAALGVVLVVLWWRLNRLEARLDKHEENHKIVHSEMWSNIRSTQSALSHLKGRLQGPSGLG